MSSLEIIKQELVKQKKLLDKKGIVVNVNNINPSPSEITSALENFTLDFTQTTATEADVKAGKTFYSQNSEIKTGTYDLSVLEELNNKLASFVSGKGPMQIIIPSNITRIRKYAYYSDPNTGDESGLFYSENLTIPENIVSIGERAFYKSNITGLLVIPETCVTIGTQCFNNSKITEVHLYGGVPTESSATYLFANCTNLKKAIIAGTVQYIPLYLFNNCSSLEEVWLPEKFANINSSVFASTSIVKLIKFTGKTLGTIYSTTFQSTKNATFLVPYLYYDTYINHTNFLAYGNPVYGHGEFEQDDNLPDSIEGYTLVWYSNLDDLQAGTNPITTATSTDTMYAIITAIANEE